jgi:hypothetical protein
VDTEVMCAASLLFPLGAPIKVCTTCLRGLGGSVHLKITILRWVTSFLRLGMFPWHPILKRQRKSHWVSIIDSPNCRMRTQETSVSRDAPCTFFRKFVDHGLTNCPTSYICKVFRAFYFSIMILGERTIRWLQQVLHHNTSSCVLLEFIKSWFCCHLNCRLRLKSDGTRAETDLVFRRNRLVHLNRRGRHFSWLLAAEVCTSAVVMLDTPCSEVVWRVLATHSIHQFPLHFPSHASLCAIRFQMHSTSGAFAWWTMTNLHINAPHWKDIHIQLPYFQGYKLCLIPAKYA